MVKVFGILFVTYSALGFVRECSSTADQSESLGVTRSTDAASSECELSEASQALRWAIAVGFEVPYLANDFPTRAMLLTGAIPGVLDNASAVQMLPPGTWAANAALGRHVLKNLGKIGSTDTVSDCGWIVEIHECGSRDHPAGTCTQWQADMFLLARHPNGKCIAAFTYSNDQDELSSVDGRFDDPNRLAADIIPKGNLGIKFGTTRFFKDEYDFATTHLRFNEIDRWTASGNCTSVIFTGFSLGGALAEIARVDFGMQNPQNQLTRMCQFGTTSKPTPCKAIAFASPLVFTNLTGISPEFAKCSEDANYYVENDEVPRRMESNRDQFPWNTWHVRFNHISGLRVFEMRRSLELAFFPFFSASLRYDHVQLPCDKNPFEVLDNLTFSGRSQSYLVDGSWLTKPSCVDLFHTASDDLNNSRLTSSCSHFFTDALFFVDFEPGDGSPQGELPMPISSPLEHLYDSTIYPSAVAGAYHQMALGQGLIN